MKHPITARGPQTMARLRYLRRKARKNRVPLRIYVRHPQDFSISAKAGDIYDIKGPAELAFMADQIIRVGRIDTHGDVVFTILKDRFRGVRP